MSAEDPEDPRVKLEFRKVLGRVSDGLGLEDVSGLKNLCYDYVTERKREEIDTGIQLFNVLIERGSYLSSEGRYNTNKLLPAHVHGGNLPLVCHVFWGGLGDFPGQTVWPATLDWSRHY